MVAMGIVKGSVESAIPLEISVTTVYERTNIRKLPPDEYGSIFYVYNEVQYEKDEFITLMAKQNLELAQQNIDIQLALTEVYEGGLANG